MGNVDWSNVKQPDAEEAAEEKGGWLGTLLFIIVVILGLAAGLSYVNYVMLGERVRKIVIDDGGDAVHVRQHHEDCYSKNVTITVPQSAAAFQTADDSPNFGIGSVNMQGYRTCVLPMKAK